MGFFESIVYFALHIGFVAGYLINLIAAFHSHGLEAAARGVGVGIPPIGVILGYFF
jgi:hypothetical protein